MNMSVYPKNHYLYKSSYRKSSKLIFIETLKWNKNVEWCMLNEK
jgi:hypothetical protein